MPLPSASSAVTDGAALQNTTDPPSPLPRHPSGLLVLCLVEFLERFAGGLLGALLVLYLNERIGLSQAGAMRLAGLFNGLSYGLGLLGGWLGDRFLGSRRAIGLGALLLALGYTLFASTQAALYFALVALALGHGLFKPNLAASLSKLYPEPGEERQAGFSLLYQAINLGGLLGPLAGGALRASHGWPLAFASAATAMGLCLAVFVLGRTQLGALSVVGAGPSSPRYGGSVPAGSLGALAALLAVTVLFTVAMGQSEGTLLLWARDCTRRTFGPLELPPSVFAAVPSLFVLVFGALSALRSRAAARAQSWTAPARTLAAGLALGALCFAILLAAACLRRPGEEVSALWLLGGLAALSLGELCVLPLGMALAASLAPRGRSALALGLWTLATALGFGLAGAVGALWARWPLPWFFGFVSLLGLGALVLWLALLPRLGRALASLSRR